MKILDILNGPWMINVEYHQEMSQLYKSHMLGEKIDFKAFESAFADSLKRGQPDNELNIQNGIAIIDATGPLTPQASFFSFFFEGTAMPDISRQIKLADESTEVKEKLFNMNTPGSTVEGMFELAEEVRESAKIKPFKTFTNGMIASGGYLLAAATDEIIISSVSNLIGSIGVIASKTDRTELQKEIGIVTTEYVSGRYKNIGSSTRARDDFEDKAIQGTVDYMASLFFDNVSQDRNLSVEFIAGLEAKLLIGQQAIDAGLVDGVSTLDAIIKPGGSSADFAPSAKTLKIEVNEMSEALTIAQIQTDSAESYKAILKQGSDEGAAQATVDERLRISSIHSVTPGFEAVKKECIDTGLDVGQSAIKLLKAKDEQPTDEAAKLAAEKLNLSAEAQLAVKLKETETIAATAKKKEDEAAADTKTPEETFKASAELQAEFGDVETYQAYVTAFDNGQVKTFKKEEK